MLIILLSCEIKDLYNKLYILINLLFLVLKCRLASSNLWASVLSFTFSGIGWLKSAMIRKAGFITLKEKRFILDEIHERDNKVLPSFILPGEKNPKD